MSRFIIMCPGLSSCSSTSNSAIAYLLVVQNPGDDVGSSQIMLPGAPAGGAGQMNPSGPNMNMGGAGGNLASMIGSGGGAGNDQDNQQAKA